MLFLPHLIPSAALLVVTGAAETPGVKEKGLLERDGSGRGRRREYQGIKEWLPLDNGDARLSQRPEDGKCLFGVPHLPV